MEFKRYLKTKIKIGVGGQVQKYKNKIEIWMNTIKMKKNGLVFKTKKIKRSKRASESMSGNAQHVSF